MELQDIISHFRSPKPNGNNSYMVTCPCHNDNTQSLCISEDNGKILLNCFAGCRAEDITRAIGLSMRDLFQAPPQSSKPPKPASIEYRYGDRLKKIRFYIWKNGKWQKSFCWKHKDNNGEWQKGRGGINPPLYNQEILSNAAADSTVYIVEGEKDADTMTDKVGLPAVSAPDGATKGNKGKKWDNRFNSLFTGLNVAIVPDNDEAGKNFAGIVANELLTVAHSVKVLDLCTEWENLKEKGDITDIYENEQPSRNKTVAQTVKYKIEALKDCTTAVTEPLKQAEGTETKTPESNIKYAPKWVYRDDCGKLKVNEGEYIKPFTYDDMKEYKPNDIETAEFFASLTKEFLCYISPERSFYIYNGVVWECDDIKDNLKTGKMLMKFVKAAQALIPPKPKGEPKYWTDEETAEERVNSLYRQQYKSLGNANGRERVLKDIKKLLRKDPEIFDKNPELLNTRNYTLNLETCEIQPHRAADYITKCTATDYIQGETNERFNSFINEVCRNDAETIQALQRALGYSLMGTAHEECLFIAYGKTTRNGKGTLFDLVLETLGTYGRQISFDTLARSNSFDGSKPTPDLAVLKGTRFVLANEPQKGVCFNEGLVKQMTGNDTMVARHLQCEPITFRFKGVIFITANNLPTVADSSLYESDRIKILLFDKHFSEEERDTTLKRTLREGNGKAAVLNWLIEGYKQYRKHGLLMTPQAKQVLNNYRAENDYIQQFIDEGLILYDPDDRSAPKVKLLEVQREYNEWCRVSGIKPLGKKLLKEALTDHNVSIRDLHGSQAIRGRINPELFQNTVDIIA